MGKSHKPQRQGAGAVGRRAAARLTLQVAQGEGPLRLLLAVEVVPSICNLRCCHRGASVLISSHKWHPPVWCCRLSQAPHDCRTLPDSQCPARRHTRTAIMDSSLSCWKTLNWGPHRPAAAVSKAVLNLRQ